MDISVWNETFQRFIPNFIISLSVYLSLWENPNDWAFIENTRGGYITVIRLVPQTGLATLRWSIWRFDVCLSCLDYNMCLIQTYNTHLTLYRALWYYKLSMRPLRTLCTLFIDALWLWSRWLCSQCCWCFYFWSYKTDYIIHLSLVFILVIVSVVLLCCDKPIWCQQCFYLFYFSCNKKAFSCSIFLDSTFDNVLPPQRNSFLTTEALERTTADPFANFFLIIQWNIMI